MAAVDAGRNLAALDARVNLFRDDPILVRLEVAFARAFTAASMRIAIMDLAAYVQLGALSAVPPGVVAGH